MSTQPWEPDPIRVEAHARYETAFELLTEFLGGGLTDEQLRPFVDDLDAAWSDLPTDLRADLWVLRRHRWLKAFVAGLDEGLGRPCDCLELP